MIRNKIKHPFMQWRLRPNIWRFVASISLLLLAGYSPCFSASRSPNAEHPQMASDSIGPLEALRRARQTFRKEKGGGNPDSGIRKRTPFGLHAVGMPFLKEVGETNASIIRIIITGAVWKKVETTHGLDFSQLDIIVRELQNSGMDLVITLDSNSEKWGERRLFNKKKGGIEPTIHSDKPAKMALYEESLRAIVERYDNDGIDDMPGLAYSVDYYQIVNEWVWQWESGKSDYLDHLKSSRKIITSAHPGAQIILGGLTGVEYMAVEEGVEKSRSLKMGGMIGMDRPKMVTIDELKTKRPQQVEDSIEKVMYLLVEGRPYYDIIDFHSYTESYEEMIPLVEVIKKYAPNKEIWSLENAGPYYRYTPEKHSEEVVKRYVVGLAHGIRKMFWSSYNPTGGWSKNFLNLSLIDKRGRKKAAWYTYQFLAGNMDGVESVSKVVLEPGVEAYKVTAGDGELYVIWSDGGEKKTRLPWSREMDGVRAVRLDVVNSRRIEVRDVPSTWSEGELELDASEIPIFVGRGIREY